MKRFHKRQKGFTLIELLIVIIIIGILAAIAIPMFLNQRDKAKEPSGQGGRALDPGRCADAGDRQRRHSIPRPPGHDTTLKAVPVGHRQLPEQPVRDCTETKNELNGGSLVKAEGTSSTANGPTCK